jgi:hypothetical protein
MRKSKCPQAYMRSLSKNAERLEDTENRNGGLDDRSSNT